ncbi:MAG TPA: hypothetical protein PKE03_10675 [Bacteroidales bacterium]|nr:hypothetical protein [Bacteroidales bacterium]
MNDIIEKQTLRKVNFIYWFMFLAAVLVYAASLALAKTANFHWLPDFMGFIHLVVSAVFAIGALVGSRILAGNIFARADVIENRAKLSEFYGLWVMIRLSLALLASLLSSIGYLLTSNLPLLIIATMMVLVVTAYRPSQAKAASMLDKFRKDQSAR